MSCTKTGLLLKATVFGSDISAISVLFTPAVVYTCV